MARGAGGKLYGLAYASNKAAKSISRNNKDNNSENNKNNISLIKVKIFGGLFILVVVVVVGGYQAYQGIKKSLKKGRELQGR